VDSSGPQWKLLEGDVKVTLHPGDVPDSLVTAQPMTPSSEPKEGNYLIAKMEPPICSGIQH